MDKMSDTAKSRKISGRNVYDMSMGRVVSAMGSEGPKGIKSDPETWTK